MKLTHHFGPSRLNLQRPIMSSLSYQIENRFAMKYLPILILCFLFARTQAQVVDIPDPKFLSALIDRGVDRNHDGIIQRTESVLVTELIIAFRDIDSLDGINSFINLRKLYVQRNNLTKLNLQGLSYLQTLAVSSNNLSTLDLSRTPLLEELMCSGNNLSALDLSQTPLLWDLSCGGNDLSILDLGYTPLLSRLTCSNNNISMLDFSHAPLIGLISCANNNLSQLILKNGNPGFWVELYFEFNPNLQFVCVNDEDLPFIQQILDDYGQPDVILNTYCSFDPGGDFSIIEGQTIYDLNNNGCDTADIAYPYLKLTINDGAEDYYLISSQTGEYNIPVADGDYAIKPLLENTTYFNANPDSFQVSFPTDSSPYFQDICITANDIHHDVDVVIIPLTPARPGFISSYKIQYQNKGNSTRAGSFSFSYDDNLMDLKAISQVADTSLSGYLSWNYADLLPFESRSITLSFELSTPLDMPPLNGDDALGFTAVIYPIADDETPADNIFTLSQTVVNSFDPNDKNCLEGKIVSPEKVGEYLHYMIRFENTGTASAVNIVVKDVIDTAVFDISTIYIIDASHDVVTRIRDVNIVEFIFEEIYLEFDDAINDGYVVFKIKTKSDLVIGDQLTNTAEIYFDFNAPIITNEAISTIDENSTVVFAPIQTSSIQVFPNPFDGMIQISAKDQIHSVRIIDIKGHLIHSYQYDELNTEVRISTLALAAGLYLLEVVTSDGLYLEKVVK